MDRLAFIDNKINQKIARVPDNISIVTPGDMIPAQIQADWLILLLCRMYTEHGITKRRDQLIKDIEHQDCKTWFAVKEGKPVASAALVAQTDGSREIGRAVSLENGVGGLLMMMAAKEHLSTSASPLVAEVRVADEYLGVPSGEATETICLKHLGLTPHALVPAFNHGSPVRQEQFLFSSSQPLTVAETVALPEDRHSSNLIRSTAIALAENRFHKKIRVEACSNHRESLGWDVVMTSPFSVALPSKKSSANLEKILDFTESQSAFTLLPIEARPEAVGAITECLNQGFVPCGVDRNLGEHGHPVILLGKLRANTLLAPIKINKDVVTPEEALAIAIIDQAFRQKLRVW